MPGPKPHNAPLPVRYQLIEPNGREHIISAKAPMTPEMVGLMVTTVLGGSNTNNSPPPAAIAKPVASSQAGAAAAGHLRTTDLAESARLPVSHTKT